MRGCKVLIALLAGCAASAAAASREDAGLAAPAWLAKIDPWVLATGAQGPTEFLVFLREQADLQGAERLITKEAKGRFVFDRLTAVAGRTQGPLLDLLSQRGIEHQAFWVANMIRVRGDLPLAEELAARDDVAYLHANPTVHFEAPVEDEEARRAFDRAVMQFPRCPDCALLRGSQPRGRARVPPGRPVPLATHRLRP